MNMRNAFADTMVEVGKSDQNLVVLVGDISHGILKPFAEECPGRYFNIGILEPTIVSMSAGLSATGLHPVAHTIAPFLIERSLEQIKLDFCYQEISGTLITVGSAFDYSGLGCTHHCYDDLGVIKALPNTQVLYPSMPNEFNILFKESYNNCYLTYFRLPGDMHDYQINNEKIKLGKGILIQEGKDITIFVIGPQLKTVLKTVETLTSKGIEPEILYYPTIKPFDRDLLRKSVEKTRKIITIEEHSRFGGINQDVLFETCNIDNVRYEFINIPDEFSRGYGSYQEHCEHNGFSVDNIVYKIEKLMSQ